MTGCTHGHTPAPRAACLRWWCSAWRRLLPSLAVTLALAGCAAQQALEQGQRLVAAGRTQEGLAKLQEAVLLEPQSAQIRMAYLVQRDRATQGLMEKAEAARQQGRMEQAEAVWREVLALHPGHERAQAALRAAEQDRRWTQTLAEADVLLGRKQTEAARDKARSVLLEAPRHARARALLEKIEQLQDRASPEAALAASFRKPISIEFKDASLRTIFDIIARTSGLNFLFDKDVRTDQKTSIFLRNSTVEAAVQMLLVTNQLEQRVMDAGTVLIYPASANKLREYQPLSVRTFYLSNAEAKVVAATIKSIAKSKDVVVDDKLNMIIVRDSPSALRLVEKLVAVHDMPEPEVMLEVEILEVKRTRLMDLGVRLPDQLSLAPLAATAGGAITLRDLREIDSSRVGATLGASSVGLKRQLTDANILANPRIRTRNREKAKILIGERVPNITTTLTATGFSTDSVNYVDVGLKLEVEPVIYPEGDVSIRVQLEVSNIINQVQTKSGSLAFQIGTRGAQTVLRLADGENQVLAGLINDEDRRTADRLPGAGDIPLLGRLFGRQADDSIKTEIVLSITPRIVRNIPRPSATLAEFESGTEASVGVRMGLGGAGSAATTGAATAPAPAPISAPAPVPSTVSTSAGSSGSTASPTAATVGASSAAGPNGSSSNSGPSVGASTAAEPSQRAQANSGTGPANAEPASAPPDGSLQLSWVAPREVKVGDTVTLQVMARGEEPPGDIGLTLGYDPTVLQHISTTEGDFMRTDGATTQFMSRPDAGGQVVTALSRSGGANSSSTAPSGVLVSYSFRALAASSAALIELTKTSANRRGGGTATVAAPASLKLSVAGQP